MAVVKVKEIQGAKRVGNGEVAMNRGQAICSFEGKVIKTFTPFFITRSRSRTRNAKYNQQLLQSTPSSSSSDSLRLPGRIH